MPLVTLLGTMRWGELETDNGVIEFTPNHDYQFEGKRCFCLFLVTGNEYRLLRAMVVEP